MHELEDKFNKKFKILDINNDPEFKKLSQQPEMMDLINKYIPIIADILFAVNNNLSISLIE